VRERLIQGTAVGCGEHRIAGAGKQGANLAFAGGADLFRECRGGQFAIEFRQIPNAAAMAGKAAGAGARHLIHCRQGEQAAALAIEVARGDIDQLDQPLAERAEALRRHAHAAVADGRIRGGEVPRDAAYHVRLDAAVRRRALRRECRDACAPCPGRG
jgi:hypothetical protein